MPTNNHNDFIKGSVKEKTISTVDYPIHSLPADITLAKMSRMSQEFDHLQGNAKIEAENEYLKMKLMLEKGAVFGGNLRHKLPPEIENQFLRAIETIERETAVMKFTTIFKKVGSPDMFPPVNSISDTDINSMWKKVQEHLKAHAVRLDVFSPNISKRELYRFATEELFSFEIMDMDMPGMVTGFIYDEYYPDPLFENAGLVIQCLLREIFRKEKLMSEEVYNPAGFDFNGKPQRFSDFNRTISQFKILFDSIKLKKAFVEECTVDSENSIVKGSYEAKAMASPQVVVFSGTFEVSLKKIKDDWHFTQIRITGFNPI